MRVPVQSQVHTGHRHAVELVRLVIEQDRGLSGIDMWHKLVQRSTEYIRAIVPSYQIECIARGDNLIDHQMANRTEPLALLDFVRRYS